MSDSMIETSIPEPVPVRFRQEPPLCMNKNVVVTGTVLSLLRIFLQNNAMNDSIKDMLSGIEKSTKKMTKIKTNVMSENYSKVLVVGIVVCYSLLQKHVSREKKDVWMTLDSISTIFAILFEIFVAVNLRYAYRTTSLQNMLMKLFSSVLAIFTLTGHNRGINPNFSMLMMFLIELITFSISSNYTPNFLSMILVVALPFLWDKFEKGKKGKEQNDDSKYYTVMNASRVVIMFLFVIFFYLGTRV